MRSNLKKARTDAGLTQEQMAERLGISLRHYKYIESGKVVGNVEFWDAMEDLFEIHQRILREIHPCKADNP
jgi:transcriptional regulator with XRE-family HTH domain